MTEIDYTRYSLDDLLDCQETIDRSAFPERAAQIDLLIRDRLRQQPHEPTGEPPARSDHADGKGPEMRFVKGIMELIAGIVVGVVFLNAEGALWASAMPPAFAQHFGLAAWLSIAWGILIGGYHIYGAISESRP